MTDDGNSLGDLGLSGTLRDVSCPALVVHGRQDSILFEASQAVAAALHAEVVILDDCGRVPYVEQPDALFRATWGFLDRLPHTRA
jgi:pimeloyl-ACP methyl ester carboxylesterase